MARVLVPELLDRDQGSPDEIAASLRDLDRINRIFGGVSTTARMLRRLREETGRGEFSVLDVGAGSSRVVEMAAKRAGVKVSATFVDRVPSHLRDRRSIAADALSLPFAERSFDVVHSCLFLHHLTENETVRFLRESLRVSRLAVLVNDLRRSPAHLMAVRLASPWLFSTITQHDAPASVRRAYTRPELSELMKGSGASRFEVENSFLFRLAGIVWT